MKTPTNKPSLELLADIESFIVDKVDDLNLAHNECKNTKAYVHKVFHFDTLETALKEKENTEKTIDEIFSENGKVVTTIDIKKKLKALDIIKDLLFTIFDEISFNDEKNEILFSDHYGVVFTRQYKNKEKYDLLKEVLL